MALQVEWIDDADRFRALGGEWEALLPADANPFDLCEWYSLWWEAFGGTRELAVCAVRRDGELAAALPLGRHGPRLQGLVNGHSGLYRPLARDEEALAALADGAFAGLGRELEISAVPSGDPGLAALVAGAERARALALPEAGYTSPIVATAGELEDWRRHSHGSWKSRLARYRRKMTRDHEAEFQIVAGADDLDAWLEEGFALEASGWKGEAGTAIESSPDTAGFYRAIARHFHERDQLRLSRIALDGRAVAFSFCILYGNRLYSLKTGFDESLRKLVPGLVMQLSIVERCFELGLDSYELLGDDAEWKRKIATDYREHTDLRAFARTPAGAARYGYRRNLRPGLRRAYRRLRPRTR